MALAAGTRAPLSLPILRCPRRLQRLGRWPQRYAAQEHCPPRPHGLAQLESQLLSPPAVPLPRVLPHRPTATPGWRRDRLTHSMHAVLRCQPPATPPVGEPRGGRTSRGASPPQTPSAHGLIPLRIEQRGQRQPARCGAGPFAVPTLGLPHDPYCASRGRSPGLLGASAPHTQGGEWSKRSSAVALLSAPLACRHSAQRRVHPIAPGAREGPRLRPSMR